MYGDEHTSICNLLDVLSAYMRSFLKGKAMIFSVKVLVKEIHYDLFWIICLDVLSEMNDCL